MFCKNCGAEMTEGAAFCVKCGFAANTGDHYCPTCGVAVEPGQAVCVACGHVLGDLAASAGKSTKSKLAAGLLAIFVGTFGVHNFYLGKTKRALIQLLVTVLTCGIGSIGMSIWALVEGIFILIGHDGYTTDAEGKTLTD